MKSTKISESNRYTYLISLDLELDNKGDLIGELSFGGVAPGITGGDVRYHVKRATLEVTTQDGKFSEVYLLNPANVAAGVNIGRTKEIGSQTENALEKADESKASISMKPSISSSCKDKSSSKDNQNTKTIDNFDYKKYTFSCYGDKKRNTRWDFEPFEEKGLKGNLKSLLANVVPDDGKNVFLIDAAVSIAQDDIEPIVTKEKGTLRRIQEQVIKWYTKTPFDVSTPVSTIKLSVSREESSDEVNAA